MCALEDKVDPKANTVFKLKGELENIVLENVSVPDFQF